MHRNWQTIVLEMIHPITGGRRNAGQASNVLLQIISHLANCRFI